MSAPPPPGWVSPEGPGPGPAYRPAYGPAGGVPTHKPGVVALRPLGLGDLFDGAFKTIRRNPKAMVGLAAVVTTVFMVIPVLLALVLAARGELAADLFDTSALDNGAELSAAFESGALSAVSNLGTLFGFLATVVLNGMLVQVVAEAVLGRRSGIAETWAATRGRLPRLAGLMFLNLLLAILLVGVPVALGVVVGLSTGMGQGVLVGALLLLVGIALLVFVQVRFFLLAAPALVLERTGVLASMRRAGALSRAQFWRLFGIYLLTSLVAGLIGFVIGIPLSLVGVLGTVLLPGTGGGLVLVFSSYLSQIIVGAITTPFTSAVVALQYVDQRMRKEGLDVQLVAASQHSRPDPR